MFTFEEFNELYCKATGNGTIYAKRGSMVAYEGNFDFEKLILGPSNNKGLLGSLMGHAQRALTGEELELMVAKGSGTLYLAENAYHVQNFHLEPGMTIYVESENLLAFSDNIHYSVKMIGSGVLSQKGLFTTKLTNKTNETQHVALILDGNPAILQGPCCVDPDAIVAWIGREPNIKMAKLSWKTFIGQTSGESYHLEFIEPGQFVIIQPSERLSGLKISID